MLRVWYPEGHALVEFEYDNWRGDHHTYTVQPESIEYERYDHEDATAEAGEYHWLFHGFVTKRDGEERDLHTNRRSFLIEKIVNLKEA